MKKIEELIEKKNLKKLGRAELYENFRSYRKAAQTMLLLFGYSVEDSYKFVEALTNYYFPQNGGVNSIHTPKKKENDFVFEDEELFGV